MEIKKDIKIACFLGYVHIILKFPYKKTRRLFSCQEAARKYWWTRSDSGGTKAEKEAEVSESDKNQRDIWSYFAATPPQATKKTETKEPKSPNVIAIDCGL